MKVSFDRVLGLEDGCLKCKRERGGGSNLGGCYGMGTEDLTGEFGDEQWFLVGYFGGVRWRRVFWVGFIWIWLRRRCWVGME